MKKSLLIVIISIMVAVLFTGCGTQSSKSISYEDGVYTASNPEFDDHGWKGTIEITVEDGKIVKVVYDEINEEDERKKSEDDEYKDNFKSKMNVDIEEAFNDLQNQLVEKQNPDKVDAYTGATHGSNNFKNLAKKALKEATK